MNDLSPEELRTVAFIAWKTLQTEKKDLASYVLTARCVMTAAEALAKVKQATEYKTMVMRLAYNIASAAWPGWEDAHTNIPDDIRVLALEMCKLNVALSEELNLPPERKSAGQWMTGAHQLANSQYELARASFNAAAELGTQAGQKDGPLMAQGWVIVCDILAGKDGTSALDDIKQQLMALGEDGQFYASQYEPALKVFR
jgi:hypothetical protein